MRQKLIDPFKNYWQFLFVNGIFSIFFNFFFWNESFKDPKIFFYGWLWALTICLSQWLGNAYFGIKVGEKFSWFDKPKKRLFFGVITIVVYSSIAYILVQFLMNYVFFGSIPSNTSNWIINQLKVTIPIALVISFAFNSIGFFKAWRTAELNAQKLETEMLQYKYESLQNQINPHFLFNSFNVLTDLIEADSKMAVKFVQKMSGLYRYVLESKDKELVPLSEELDFIKQYVFLLETRFDKKVIFNVDLTDTQNIFVVPMALQLLIENSVKHNIASSKKVLTIDVFRNEKSLIVQNNLQLKSSLERSTKKGLENLKQQYTFFTDVVIEIEQTESFFKVEIPLLEK